MGQTKVRCQFCGAKNTDEKTERCRICGGVLPDAAERRKKAEEGETFKALVEAEVDTWRDYTEGRFDAGGRSRRPAELPPVFARDRGSRTGNGAEPTDPFTRVAD